MRPTDRLGAQAASDDSTRLVSGPRRTGDGYFEAVVRSPEGALIEIVG